MELLDRYLHAIEFCLPKRQRHDILAELSEDLRSQIEEKETELGRKLEDAEVEAILKRCGAPLEVASRYRPQQYLIGPALFWIYRFVLAVSLIRGVVPRFLILLVFLLVDPVHRSYFHMEKMRVTVVYLAFFTALAFAIAERSGVKLEALNTWNPRKLPPVAAPNRISGFGSLFEIAAGIVVNLWFVGIFWPRPTIDFYRVRITIAPVWQVFFCSFLFLAAANVAIASVNLFRPYWTPRRASLRLLFDGLGAGLFCGLLKAHLLVGISAPSIPAAKAIELTNLINTLIARMLPWAIVTLLVMLSFDVFRIMRLRCVHPRGGPIGRAVKDLASPMVNGNCAAGCCSG